MYHGQTTKFNLSSVLWSNDQTYQMYRGQTIKLIKFIMVKRPNLSNYGQMIPKGHAIEKVLSL